MDILTLLVEVQESAVAQFFTRVIVKHNDTTWAAQELEYRKARMTEAEVAYVQWLLRTHKVD